MLLVFVCIYICVCVLHSSMCWTNRCQAGYDEIVLSTLLRQAGFCDIERVADFNIVPDTSSMVFEGYEISLNLIAKPCIPVDVRMVEFTISHNARPYIREATKTGQRRAMMMNKTPS